MGIECLLKHQGDKRKAGIANNFRPDNFAPEAYSSPPAMPSVEVMALYTIASIFGKPDYVRFPVLYDHDHNANTKKSIKKAYKYYRE